MFQIRVLICWLFLLLPLLLSPWLFGGYPEWARFWLALPLSVACLFCSLWAVKSPSGYHVNSVAFFLSAITIYALFQLIPLNMPALSRLEHSVLAELLHPPFKQSDFSEPNGFSPTSVSSWRTLNETAVYGISLSLFVSVSLLIQAVPRSGSILLTSLLANGVFLALYGMYQKLRWDQRIFGFIQPEQGGQPFASFVNRNNAAAYLLVCFAAGIGLLLLHRRDDSRDEIPTPQQEKQRQEKAVMIGISLSLIAAGIVASLSRSGIVSLLTGLLVLVVFFRQRSQAFSLLPLLSVGLWGAIIISFGWSQQSLARFLEIDQESIRLGRVEHWQHTSESWRDFDLLGSGLGTYREANRPYQTSSIWFMNADNQYVEWTLELGGIGLILIAALLVYLFWNNRRLFRRKEVSTQFLAGAALLLFLLTSQLTHALFDFGITLPATQWSAAIVCAIALGPLQQAKSGQKPGQQRVYSSQNSLSILKRFQFPNFVWGVMSFLFMLGSVLVLFVSTKAEQIHLSARVSMVSKPEDSQETRELTLQQLANFENRFPEIPEITQTKAQLAEHDLQQEFLTILREEGELRSDRQAKQLSELRLLVFSSLGLKPVQDQLRTLVKERRSLHHQASELEKILGECVRQTPLRGDLWGKLALTRWLLEKPAQETLNAGRLAAVLRPFDDDSLLLYALLLADFGENAESQQVYTTILKQDSPKWLQVWNAARRHYSVAQIAEHIMPAVPEIWLNLMQAIPAQAERKQFAELAQQYYPFEEEKSASGFYLRGYCAVQAGQTAEAVEFLTEAVNLNPLNPLWRLELARQLLIQSNPDEALEQLKRANRLDPENRQIQQLYQQILSLPKS